MRQSEQPKRLDQDYEEHWAPLSTDRRTGPVEGNPQLFITMQAKSCSIELPLIPAHLAMALEYDVVGLVAGRGAVQKKNRKTVLSPLQVVQHQAMQEDAFIELEIEGSLQIVTGEAKVGLKTAESAPSFTTTTFTTDQSKASKKPRWRVERLGLETEAGLGPESR
jgi:hypothetical protein